MVFTNQLLCLIRILVQGLELLVEKKKKTVFLDRCQCAQTSLVTGLLILDVLTRVLLIPNFFISEKIALPNEYVYKVVRVYTENCQYNIKY